MYVLSVSGLMRKKDIGISMPHSDLFKKNAPTWLANGGSCIAAPDGTWLIEPIINKEIVQTATINLAEIRKERQNFDISGHYARPDVFSLQVNTERQKLVHFNGCNVKNI